LEKLLNWRKSSKAVHSGSLKHFTPHDNVYVYNRKSADESVLVIINNKSENAEMDMTRYQEVLKGFTSAVDVISGRVLESLENIEIEGNSSLVLELK
jgi:glycosidase